MKKVRFTYRDKKELGQDMIVLEISTDGGATWEFSRGYVIVDCDRGSTINVDAITELQRCVSLGYQFVLN